MHPDFMMPEDALDKSGTLAIRGIKGFDPKNRSWDAIDFSHAVAFETLLQAKCVAPS